MHGRKEDDNKWVLRVAKGAHKNRRNFKKKMKERKTKQKRGKGGME
jgi:hypothetical protein